MAIFQPGPLAGTISGPVGGTLFKSTRQGGVIQARPRRTPIRSERALNIRRRMQATQLRWQELTDNQRTAWGAAALTFPHRNRLGVRTLITGHQLFLLVNVQFYPVITFTEGIFAITPVDLRRLPPKRPQTLDFTAGGPYLVNFEVPIPTSNSVWIVEYGRPFNDRAYRSWNTWTLVNAITTGSPPQSDITSIMLAQAPPFLQGERLFIRLHSTIIGAQPILAGVLSTILK